MMQATNFCRQFLKYGQAGNTPAGDLAFTEVWEEAQTLADVTQKFLLPSGGRVLNDPDFRALGNELHLPFREIALEYFEPVASKPGEIQASKRIVFASHAEDLILIVPVYFQDKTQDWIALPAAAIPTRGWGSASGIAFAKTDQRIPDKNYQDEISVLLCFLNALECSNVHIERTEARKKGKALKALDFDTYHTLTIGLPSSGRGRAGGGYHRSPREHLRRGHIRRLGVSKIWVNAAVVNAGTSGKITKDYSVKTEAACQT